MLGRPVSARARRVVRVGEGFERDGRRKRRTAARDPRIFGGFPPWTSWRRLSDDGPVRSCPSGVVCRVDRVGMIIR